MNVVRSANVASIEQVFIEQIDRDGTRFIAGFGRIY